MEKNKIEDIFTMLDDLAKEPSNKKTSYKQRQKASSEPITVKVVKKPTLPNITECNGRFDCFEQLLLNVDYGLENSETYVEGHQSALNRYQKIARANEKNLVIVESALNEEMKKMADEDKRDIYVKGYYDGLMYTYRALRKSKEIISKQIFHILKKELR